MEMPKEGTEEVQIINEVIIPERLRHCPECKEKDIISSVERLQYEEDRYWVFCTRRDDCSFLEEFIGKAVINKEDLTIYGLPGQLAEHMDIFYEDINKIVRLCMSECIKMRCLGAPMADFDLKGVKESVNTLAKDVMVDFSQSKEPTRTIECNLRAVNDVATPVNNPHNLQGIGQPIQPIKIHECDLTAEQNMASTPVSSQHVGGFNQPSLSTKTDECHLTAEEKLVGTQATFQDLSGLSQPPLPTNLNECVVFGNEDPINLCYDLDHFREPLQPTHMKDGKLALLKDRKSKTDECHLTAEEKLVGTQATFQDLSGLSQPPLPTNLNECVVFGNEDLVNLCYDLDHFREPLQPTNMKDGKLALLKDRKSKFKRSLNNSRDFYRQPKCYTLCESLEKLAKSLVADLPFHYQEKIKIAFSKIEGYNFPDDFLSMTSPDKLPLFKIVEKREKEQRIKAEMDEQLMGFMDEIDGLKELFE